MAFELHPQLAKDCIELGSFKLCRLLLMDDANYPWFILVPQRENIREIYELSAEDQLLFLNESNLLSETLVNVFNADKLNVAALGNVVPQLHIHHVVRYTSDAAWPSPVWGKVEIIHYSNKKREEVISKLKAGLENEFRNF